MAKGGVSTVFATILAALLSVLLVGVLWSAVQPIVSSSILPEPLAQFRIDSDRSYTVYDNDAGLLSIRVQRGDDDDDPPVIALKFVLNIEGNSVLRNTYNVVSPNQATVYYMVIGYDLPLTSVSVAPIFLINGEEVEGKAVDLATKIAVDPGRLKNQLGGVEIAVDPTIAVADGLQLYYSFDEGYAAAREILDQSGAGHVGSLIGDVHLQSEDGRQFASFDGVGDFIAVSNGQRLADVTSGDRTVVFWARFDCPAGISNSNQVPFGSRGNYLILMVDPCHEFVDTELRVSYDSPQADPHMFVSEHIWNDLDEWEHFAFVFDAAAGAVSIYRKGQVADVRYGLSLSASNPDPHFYVGTSADVGGGPNGFSFLKVSLDELRVYDRTLSEEEVRELFVFGQ